MLDTLARQLRAAGDQRALDELRHNIALDLILGKFDSRVQVHAYLHVPATTLAGITEDPGTYRPPASPARYIEARDTTWTAPGRTRPAPPLPPRSHGPLGPTAAAPATTT